MGIIHDLSLNGLAPKIAVPRVIGCSIPQKSSNKTYAKLMLAHFKPFSAIKWLLNDGETIEEAYNKYSLIPLAVK